MSPRKRSKAKSKVRTNGFVRTKDDAAPKRRLRGAILRLIYESRENRRAGRFDEVTLHSALDTLKFDVSAKELKAALLLLGELDYIRFVKEKDRDTGKIALRRIEITPEGRDVAYRIKTDAAVEVE